MNIFETVRASLLLPGFLALSLSAQVVCAEEPPITEPETTADGESKENKDNKREARKREVGAEEDPSVRQATEAAKKGVEGVFEDFDLKLYGSARVRYRQIDSDGDWSDGGSRIGLTGGWSFSPNFRLFGRAEAGVNLLEGALRLFNPGDRPPSNERGDGLFRRLLNVGIETPRVVLTAGKAWSTYYRVSSFTDRFQGTGASASGTYNAGTDGGNTGTGRADGVLQARGFFGRLQRDLLLHPVGLNLQVQNGEPIPLAQGKYYKTTVGLSSVYEADTGFATGVAYNHANIDDADLEELRSIGIDGDATALVVGARWYRDNLYVGTVVSRLQNQDTTDEGTYFDGTGWEVYSQYRVHGRWWAVAGWNILEPDSSQTQAGAYKIDYGVLGIRYSFQDFRQMIFANVRFESTVTEAGLSPSDVYTIGVRWDLP